MINADGSYTTNDDEAVLFDEHDADTVDLQAFHEYVFSFYGRGGLYPMNATIDDIRAATLISIDKYGADRFCGDSLDREIVRDILIDDFGYDWPKPYRG